MTADAHLMKDAIDASCGCRLLFLSTQLMSLILFADWFAGFLMHLSHPIPCTLPAVTFEATTLVPALWENTNFLMISHDWTHHCWSLKISKKHYPSLPQMIDFLLNYIKFFFRNISSTSSQRVIPMSSCPPLIIDRVPPLLIDPLGHLMLFIGFAWIWLEKSNGPHWISTGSEWIWLINLMKI